MSLKRKRQTSALRTLYINNNPLPEPTINRTDADSVIYDFSAEAYYHRLKLLSQRVIRVKRPNVKRCQCHDCRRWEMALKECHSIESFTREEHNVR